MPVPKTRADETPLTPDQQALLIQFLPVAEAVASRYSGQARFFSPKRGEWRAGEKYIAQEYASRAAAAIWEFLALNTNADGTDNRPGRTPEQFESHLKNRVKSRTFNALIREWRRQQKQQALVQQQAGSLGRRKAVPQDVYDGEHEKQGATWKPVCEGPMSDSGGADLTAVQEEAAAALKQMAAVDPQAAEVFRLRHAEELEIKEIARRMDLSRDQVNRRLRKAERVADLIKRGCTHESKRRAV